MKTFKLFLIFLFILSFSSSIFAHQINVNIYSPLKGSTYPKVYPHFPKIKSTYVPFGFSVTCKGNHQVTWGVDKFKLGNAKFYDSFSVNFLFKLPKGKHFFWVRSDCGKNTVEFEVR